MKRLRLRSNAGISLVEVLIAMGLLAMVLSSVIYFLLNSAKVQKYTLLKSSLMITRNNIVVSLLQNASWTKTYEAAQEDSFLCLFDGSPCPTIGEPFRVLDGNGNVVYDPATSATSGFTESGSPCETYPSDECLYRLNLSWRPLCTTCFPAQVSVIGNFVMADAQDRLSVNLSNFGFKLIKQVNNGIVIDITSNTDRFNLFNAAGSPTGPLTVRVNIAPGVYVYSTNPATPAFDVGPMPAGSKVIITNEGTIVGPGGTGGAGAPSGVCGCTAGGNGGAGGTGLKATLPIEVNNLGTIAGGGGGGGGGGAECSYIWNASAGAGGGGGGMGAGGTANGCGVTAGRFGSNGNPGSFTSGGAGGFRGNQYTCVGGAGGAPGQPGTAGQSCSAAGGSGGPPGPAVAGNSDITWISPGTIIGASQP